MPYFFDTYAIIELMKNNPNYEKFKEFEIITSIMNIGELYNIILRSKGKERAGKWFESCDFELLELTPEIMVKSIYFRYENLTKNISAADAVGYILSLKHNLKFLTGDKQFEKMPNVEFAK